MTSSNYLINNNHDRLVTIYQEFIDICDKQDIKPIIMHGSLIGWYFNRKMLPWDTNINISVIGKSTDSFIQLDGYETDTLKIWINPNIQNRIPNKTNNIDAKIIDKNNNQTVINITFLYQSVDDYFKNKVIHNLNVINTTTNPFKRSNYELKLKHYVKSITNNGENMLTYYVNCKTPHYYDIRNILPLKIEIFEEKHIYLPNNVYDCLLQEYGKHVFQPKYKYWNYDSKLEIWKK